MNSIWMFAFSMLFILINLIDCVYCIMYILYSENFWAWNIILPHWDAHEFFIHVGTNLQKKTTNNDTQYSVSYPQIHQIFDILIYFLKKPTTKKRKQIKLNLNIVNFTHFLYRRAFKWIHFNKSSNCSKIVLN